MQFARLRRGWRRDAGLGGVLLSLVVVAGCGASQGKVTGRVLYNGAPLPGGTVLFRPADPKANSVFARINDDGTYEAELPVGEVKVSVDNRDLQPPPRTQGPVRLPGINLPREVQQKFAQAKSQAPAEAAESPDALEKPSGKYVPIPDKYYSVDTSGLQFTAKGGNQTQDIELHR
jgi:hypothetical protein